MNRMIAAAGLGVALLAAAPANAVDYFSDLTGKPYETPVCAALEGYMAKSPKEQREAAVKECLEKEAKKAGEALAKLTDKWWGPNAPLPSAPLNPLNPWASDEERRHQETIRAIESLEDAVRDQTIILDRSR